MDLPKSYLKLIISFLIIIYSSLNTSASNLNGGFIYDTANYELKDTNPEFGDYIAILDSSLQTNNKKDLAITLSKLGKICSEKGKYEKALEHLLKSITIEKELNNETRIAENYNLLANVYNKSGNSNKALENYEKSLHIYQKLDSVKDISKTLNHIGLIYSNWEKYEKSLKYFQKSLEIKESSDDKSGMANCYNNIAYIYYRWGNFDHALEYNIKSLEIYQELELEIKISYALNNIGLIYVATKQYEEALGYILKSLEIEKKLNNNSGIAKSLNNIGLIYHKQGKLKLAFRYYKEALVINEKHADKEQLAIGYSNIGTIYLHNNNIKEALKYLEKSTKIAEQGNYKRTLVYNYKSFSNAYSILDDNKKALDYYKKYVTEKDSVFNKEKHKQIHELKILYETEKKEQEINLLNTENKLDKIKLRTQKKELILLGAGFFIILFLLILTFVHSTKRKIAYNDLVARNVEIAKSEKALSIVKKQSENFAKEERSSLASLHEKLNNKVENIIVKVETLSDKKTQEEIEQEHRKNIITECKNLSSDINNLLALSVENRIETNNKYSNSPISENQKQELLNGIIDLMENKKLFLDTDINLEKIANHLNSNKKYISQIINEKYDQNVSNFINEYRIKEARQLLSDSEYKKLTIEGIATSVGFNSKSAFNISFKKITGITPSFYQKSVLSQNQL
jgi:tetratricopeptide (TPR) repeat protein/AraC-like DNA-binding protein